jgi:F-type H+-transporting ATPase subunit gamma
LCRYFSVAGFEGVMQFEQDPNQILDALLPLYMNSQILRALQESLASEVGRCTS